MVRGGTDIGISSMELLLSFEFLIATTIEKETIYAQFREKKMKERKQHTTTQGKNSHRRGKPAEGKKALQASATFKQRPNFTITV